MSDNPISTNPNAVGEVGGAVAGAVKKAIGLFTGDKKSRGAEFNESSSLQKIVLDHQAAQHSHAASEAEKQRDHESKMQARFIEHGEKTGYDSTSSASFKGVHTQYSYGGNKPKEKAASSTSKPKSPVPTPPLSRTDKTVKTTATPGRGKFAPIKSPPTKSVKYRNKGK
jgi:hypothetical protein